LNAYSITDSASGVKTEVTAEGTVANELQKHVGHQVRVIGSNTGQDEMSAQQASSESVSTAGTSTAASHNKLRAQRIDVVALNCNPR
jgi:hypothetical protein